MVNGEWAIGNQYCIYAVNILIHSLLLIHHSPLLQNFHIIFILPAKVFPELCYTILSTSVYKKC